MPIWKDKRSNAYISSYLPFRKLRRKYYEHPTYQAKN